jgi:hypothetical protein
MVPRTSEDRYPTLEEIIPMTSPDSGFRSIHADA